MTPQTVTLFEAPPHHHPTAKPCIVTNKEIPIFIGDTASCEALPLAKLYISLIFCEISNSAKMDRLLRHGMDMLESYGNPASYYFELFRQDERRLKMGRRQLKLINRQLNEKHVRYQRACRANNEAFKMAIWNQILVLEEIRSFFYTYSCQAAASLEALNDFFMDHWIDPMGENLTDSELEWTDEADDEEV